MAVLIPLPTSLSIFDVRAVLDGIAVTIYCEFNVRYKSWFTRILDGDDQVVLLGDFAMRADYAIGLGQLDRGIPGYLVLRDTSGRSEDPGFDDLGARHQLIYFTAADLAPLGL